MESVSVQFALLAVSRDTAPTEPVELGIARERVTSAGHVVFAERTINDSQLQIREQLDAWIADPAIDVVIVLAGAQSDASSKALKPLIGEVLPGFTDLFRWLMFQEAGASAMLSSAEAAECSSTIVFVLPGAIAAAMDKLILPQFDPNTAPRNLVEKLPRLRTEQSPEQAVPQVIESEKTQGGSGLPQRLPAVPAPRLRSRTGANVVHRDRPTDDPTRPIDLGQLETELAASAATPNDDLTRPMLPVPAADADSPGTEDDHTDVTLAAPPPPALSRIPSILKPAPRTATSPPPRGTSTTARPGSPSTPPAARPSSPSGPRSPVRLQAGTPATPMPVTILPRGRAPSGEPARSARPQTAPQKALEVQRAIDAQNAAEARKRALTPKPMEVAKPAAPEAAKPVEPTRSESQFDAAATVEVAKRLETPVPFEVATPSRAPTTLDDESTVDGAKPVIARPVDAVETLEASELLEDASTSQEMTPIVKPVVAPPPPRPMTEPPPVPRPRPPTGPAPVVAAKRSPPPNTAKVDALPRGNFNYPATKKRGGSLVLKLLAFAAIIGVGFGAVVLIFNDKESKTTTTEPTPPPPTTTVVATAPTPDAMPTPEVTPTPTPTPEVAPPTPTPAPEIEVKPSVGTKPRVKPPTNAGSSAAVETPPTTPPDAAVAVVVDDDCDETSCILSKYDRACCAKYKPTTTDFKPRVGDVPESLDKSMVRAGIEHVKPRVVSCGEKSGVKGTVKIALTVSPEGSVTTASVADSPDASLGDCVLAAMRSAKFGKTVNGSTFTYPFAF